MNSEETTFALFFGHRGPFPHEVIPEARKELPEVLNKWGYKTLMMDENATPYGGVELGSQGHIYANWLRENRGRYDGVILCLPNFGDEDGAVKALQDAGVPILIQAYPDELDLMDTPHRRDAFCGKMSVMDVFHQYNLPFTTLKPHVVKPTSDRFKENVDYFNRLCRVVNGLRGMVVGGIGARTTPFRTVRIDEVTLQRHGIDVVTIDLSEVFARMKALSSADKAYKEKADMLDNRSSWDGVPEKAHDNLARLSVVLDQIIDEYELDAIGLRCWTEMQTQLGISPCVILGDLNERGIAAACEVDLGNAITMKALSLASGDPACCLDWNNNYGDDDDKCIVFHCGPIPPTLMTGKGKIEDHPLLGRVVGMEKGYGCNVGRIAPCDMTLGSMLTEEGKVKTFLCQGQITKDTIAPDFFGCPGVARIEGLQDVLLHLGQNGFRHHVSMSSGSVLEPVKEAFERYLGFEVTTPQKCSQ